jgi:hypothetical protein
MASSHEPDARREQLAQLSALADGTLDAREGARVEAMISAAPQLTALYRRERWAVEILHQIRGLWFPKLDRELRLAANGAPQRPARRTDRGDLAPRRSHLCPLGHRRTRGDAAKAGGLERGGPHRLAASR